MNKWLASAVVATTFAVSAPAMAATNIPLTQLTPGLYQGGVITSVGVGAFTNSFEFTVPTAGTVGASVITLTLDGSLSFSQVLLNGVGLTLTAVGGQYVATTPLGGLPSGPNPQSLIVKGSLAAGQGSGQYSTLVQFKTSAVPEPATWALMILGFGVVGYAMRRRPSVRFAQAI